MKKFVFALLFLIAPVAVFSHPGKTDHYGGHKCWKGCEEWDLMPGEYHLHDKDFTPIKTARKKTPVVNGPDEGISDTQVANTLIQPEIPQAVAQTPVPELPKQNAEKDIVAAAKNVVEGDIFPDGYSFLLLSCGLLLLFLLILRTTKKHKS